MTNQHFKTAFTFLAYHAKQQIILKDLCYAQHEPSGGNPMHSCTKDRVLFCWDSRMYKQGNVISIVQGAAVLSFVFGGNVAMNGNLSSEPIYPWQGYT